RYATVYSPCGRLSHNGTDSSYPSIETSPSCHWLSCASVTLIRLVNPSPESGFPEKRSRTSVGAVSTVDPISGSDSTSTSCACAMGGVNSSPSPVSNAAATNMRNLVGKVFCIFPPQVELGLFQRMWEATPT